MSNTTVYFGTQPSEGQTVSPSLAAKGIELTKIEMSKVAFSGGPTTVQPGFAVYKAYLPMFIRMAHGEEITDFTDPFGTIPFDDRQIPLQFPDLVVSWKYPVDDAIRAQLKEVGFRDDVVKGKPAMRLINPTVEAVNVAKNLKVNITCPTNEQSVNIFALRRCSTLRNIVSRFLATHQYPAFIDEDHESEFNKAYGSIFFKDTEAAAAAPMETDTEDDDREETKLVLKRRFKVSLHTPAERQPLYHDEHDVPQNSGLLFPFIKELAKFDRTVVLEVVKRYFYDGLGDTEEECREEFANLVSAWGNIQNTLFGLQMTHIMKVLDICMTMQCAMSYMATLKHYDGIYLRGAGYRLTILGKTYMAAPWDDLKPALKVMDRHAEALWNVLDGFSWASEEDKVAQWRKIKTMKELKVLCDTLPIAGGTGIRDRMLRNAADLTFPDEREWAPTAANIAEALSFISDPLKDLARLPYIHYTKLFVTDRLELVWSAFGSTAPSFRVPQGKEMSLQKSFKITNPKLRQEKGPAATRDVTKIGAIIIDLDMAITHMRQTFELKTVLNPFGNSVVNASASHQNKIYEKDSCDLIVNELRKAAKVTVVDSGTGGSKRSREDEEEPSVSNKKKKSAF